ncbi:hypothetical protein [Bosea thiooxidans]|uniref:hypothetical protein n=1 Tax=Bosea thiooxidans TaxID=53254 RepID=UPI0011176C21|nr:hypothetical protein [Bosea thiooxidans]
MATIVFKGVRQQRTLVVSPKADSKRFRQRDRRAGTDPREHGPGRKPNSAEGVAATAHWEGFDVGELLRQVCG